MALLIGDANVLIDLEEGRLVDDALRLPWRLGVPDILFADELSEQHSDFCERGLVLVELSAPTLERVVRLATLYPRPSRLDLSALACAQQESCPLLTGDRHLRVAAETERVRVHGTLWLAEQLVAANLVEVGRLRTAYDRMQKHGRRLPWSDVERQLRRLQGYDV